MQKVCKYNSSLLTLSQTSPGFYMSELQDFWKHCGKRRNCSGARDEQFLLFPVFSTHLESILPISSNLKLSSANLFRLEESKICRLGQGYMVKYWTRWYFEAFAGYKISLDQIMDMFFNGQKTSGKKEKIFIFIRIFYFDSECFQGFFPRRGH